MANPRKLTMAHMVNAVRRERVGETTDPQALKQDEMRLYSFYKPSLQANNYIIEAKQHISAPVGTGTQTLDIFNTRVAPVGTGTQTVAIVNTRVAEIAPQEFEVVVPRFSLDPNLINNYYPPDGHQDEGRVLPHIVLEDPHYPWEIEAGVTETIPEKKDGSGKVIQERRTMGDKTDAQVVLDPVTKENRTIYRGMVPWVALLVFDPEDLRFDDVTQLKNLKVPGYSQDVDLKKQNAKGTFTMNISDYFNTIPDSSTINYKAGYFGEDGKFDSAAYSELPNSIGTVDVIFPKKDLFTKIFGSSDPNRPGVKVGVEAYKYLTHVRHINTTGVPDAGIDEEGLFSVIISSRTGVFDQPAPHTQICHLVSIEHVDSTLGSHLSSGTESDRIGMVSLFSWIYTALPPNPVNFVDTMRNLTENQQMLRTDDKLLKKLDAAILTEDPVTIAATNPLATRLRMGYTLARWRTQSGEETAAWSRGPLVPQPVSWPGDDDNSDIPDSSKTSQEYQILDPQTGLMDLSYSSAWQAGKLAAISDTVFSSALMRFRSVVHNSSANKTRMQANGMASAQALFVSVGKSVTDVRSLAGGDTGDPLRLRSPSLKTPAPDVTQPEMMPLMRKNVKKSTQSNAGSGDAIYNEFNLDGPNNSDWAIIHTWICEKLSLGGIPAQYLIPEPAFLPPESLRFFHIDDFWLDAFLDGALSVANHLDRDDDLVKREIKETFNTYLGKVVEPAKIKPQIPSYGFIMRSKLIKAMPDLVITVTWKVSDVRYPVCRWTKWDDETLLCLLDRQPDELDSIRLAQPPHQQRYSLGSHVDNTGIVTFDLRRLYTQGAPAEWKEKPFSTDFSPRTNPSSWLDAPSRCLNISKMAKEINHELQFVSTTDTGAYIDLTPNSCELGLELNDPSYFFSIVPPANSTRAPRNRQLYVRQPKAASNAPAPMNLKAATFARSPMLVVRPSPSPPQAVVPAAAAQSTLPAQSLNSTAPHRQLRIQSQPAPVVSFNSVSRVGAAASLQAQFFLSVFPDYKGPPTRILANRGHQSFNADDYVPTGNVYFFDLIFSIRNKGNQTDQSLLRIDIDIPVTTTPTPSKTTPSLLTANYDGPGLRMLSNQRFIPFLFAPDESSPNPILHIELIPRSANLDFVIPVNDKRTAELDFRLAEANVSEMLVTTLVDVQGQDTNVKREVVQVKMTEWYKTPAHPKGEPAVTNYAVIKWKTTDDKLDP